MIYKNPTSVSGFTLSPYIMRAHSDSAFLRETPVVRAFSLPTSKHVLFLYQEMRRVFTKELPFTVFDVVCTIQEIDVNASAMHSRRVTHQYVVVQQLMAVYS